MYLQSDYVMPIMMESWDNMLKSCITTQSTLGSWTNKLLDLSLKMELTQFEAVHLTVVDYVPNHSITFYDLNG